MKAPRLRLRRISLALALSLGSLAQAQNWPGVETLAPPPNSRIGFNAVFGVDITISGDWAAVGDHGWSFLYMYKRGPSGWEYVHSIQGPVGSYLGTAIAMDGDTMVAGLRHWGWPDIGPGRLWVIERNGDEWVKTHDLLSPDLDGEAFARLGSAVDIEGDRIVASAPTYLVDSNKSGAIVVFERTGGVWEQTAFVPWAPCCPDNPAVEKGAMGLSIALSGDRIVAGAPGSAWGEVYVYELLAGGDWRRSAVILDHAPKSGGRFGNDVALSGDSLLVGRPVEGLQDNLTYDRGDAYFYEFDISTGDWVLEQVVQASDGHGGWDYGDQFGSRVALHGDRAFVSAWRHDGPGPRDGKVYELEKSGASQLWTEVVHHQSPLHEEEEGFSWSLGVSEEYLLVGVADAHISQRKRAYAIERPIGTTYCMGGGVNQLSAIGSPAITADVLSLVASELAPGSRSVFLFGEAAATTPFGGGQLCVGPAVRRIGSLRIATESGKVVEPVAFGVGPLSGFSTPGTTLYFQHWSQSAGTSPQLSDAVSVLLE